MPIDPDQIARRKRVIVQNFGDQVHEEQIVQDVSLERRQDVVKVSQLIWLLIGGLETLIAFRMFLKVIAANPDSGFTWFIYRLSDLFVWPFQNITANPSFQGHILEITSIIALLVYLVMGLVIDRLIWVVLYRTPSSQVTVYDRQDETTTHTHTNHTH